MAGGHAVDDGDIDGERIHPPVTMDGAPPRVNVLFRAMVSPVLTIGRKGLESDDY